MLFWYDLWRGFGIEKWYKDKIIKVIRCCSNCKNVVIFITFFWYEFYIYCRVLLFRHLLLSFVIFYLFKALWLTEITAESLLDQLRTCNPREATCTPKVNEDSRNYSLLRTVSTFTSSICPLPEDSIVNREYESTEDSHWIL